MVNKLAARIQCSDTLEMALAAPIWCCAPQMAGHGVSRRLARTGMQPSSIKPAEF
jgi:hypothetical protein